MASLPYMPFFVAEYLLDAGHLSDEESGAYLRLLCMAWAAPNCRLPNDDAWLARRLSRSLDTVRRLYRPIIVEFWINDGNWLFQKRQQAEWHRARDKAAKQSDNAKSRWKKEKVAYGGNADAMPSQSHSQEEKENEAIASSKKAPAEPSPPAVGPARRRGRKAKGSSADGRGEATDGLGGSTDAAVETTDGSGRERKVALPEGFTLTDERRRYAEDKVPGIDAQAEFERFRNHHLANGKTMKSWEAAWRTWVGSPYQKTMLARAQQRQRPAESSIILDAVSKIRMRMADNGPTPSLDEAADDYAEQGYLLQ